MKLPVFFLIFLGNVVVSWGQSSWERPGVVQGQIQKQLIEGFATDRIKLFVKESEKLRPIWNDVVKASLEFGLTAVPMLEIYWGWDRPAGVDGLRMDNLPFRDKRPENLSEPLKVFISPRITFFEHFGHGPEDWPKNRTAYVYFLFHLVDTWNEVIASENTIQLVEQKHWGNQGYFKLVVFPARAWQGGRIGILTILTLDNPMGLPIGFGDSGSYFELSENRGFNDPYFNGAPYIIESLDPDININDFDFGSGSTTRSVGRLRITGYPVKGYKTPAPVNVEIGQRQEVTVELKYEPN